MAELHVNEYTGDAKTLIIDTVGDARATPQIINTHVLADALHELRDNAPANSPNFNEGYEAALQDVAARFLLEFPANA